MVSSAAASLFFLFQPTTANAGDAVSVRLGGTPPGFTVAKADMSFKRAMRLYLVDNDVAGDVTTRTDSRLHFIGTLVPDRQGRGSLTFKVPPLDTASYVVATWCRSCAWHSFGRTFFVLRVPDGDTGRFRHLQQLHVRLPSAAQSCPVSPEGRNGNGFLSVYVPESGVISMQRQSDGTLFDKLGWLPKRGWGGNLTVRGERLDAPGRMRVLNVFWGHEYVDGRQGRGSWMTPVELPSEGCWRISGRVADISLSYVVQVVAAP